MTMTKTRLAISALAALFAAVALVEADAPKTPWKLTGQLEEACSCSAACPCWFGSKPTKMTCGGSQFIFIQEGTYGNVKLDGLAVGAMSQSPKGEGMMESFGSWNFNYYYIDEKATPEQRQQGRDVIGRQVDQLARLVDDLVDANRISSGKLELRRDVIDLLPIIEGAADSIRPLAERKRQNIAMTLSRGPSAISRPPENRRTGTAVVSISNRRSSLFTRRCGWKQRPHHRPSAVNSRRRVGGASGRSAKRSEGSCGATNGAARASSTSTRIAAVETTATRSCCSRVRASWSWLRPANARSSAAAPRSRVSWSG
jgi:hypothetical protein